MKKLFSLLSIAAFALALTACATHKVSTEKSMDQAPAKVKAEPQASHDYKAEIA